MDLASPKKRNPISIRHVGVLKRKPLNVRHGRTSTSGATRSHVCSTAALETGKECRDGKGAKSKPEECSGSLSLSAALGLIAVGSAVSDLV